MRTIEKTIVELGLSHELLRQGLDLVTKSRYVIRKGERELVAPLVTINENKVALSATYSAEAAIAFNIHRLMAADLEPLDFAQLSRTAGLWNGFTPHELQVEAIQTAMTSNVMLLTGGPGVGKTTIVRAALQAYRASGQQVMQVAPTGKACNRMAEQTGMPAYTIHRALGLRNDGAMYNAHKPLPCSVLIADECSMIDVHLMAALLSAVRTGARVLLVGDVDQLPSIAAGRVLHDLIVSNQLPVVRLTKIFRQASESRIPYVARDINEGRTPENLGGEGTDVRFVERATEEETLQLILAAVTTGIPEQKGIASRDIQVIAAQKSRDVGVERLNYALQAALNPTDDNESDVPVGANYQVRANDKVIHTKNNYDLGVMNGEMGWVLASAPDGVDLAAFPDVHTSEDAADAEDEDADEVDYEVEKRGRKATYVLVVDFGHRTVAYTKTEARELQLGYAITVHKSQGSQFKAVVMPVHSCHAYMLTRSLVYTGITRAEKYVLMVGQAATVARAARNTRGAERRTQLQRLLSQA